MCAVPKTQHSQINEQILKKKKVGQNTSRVKSDCSETTSSWNSWVGEPQARQEGNATESPPLPLLLSPSPRLHWAPPAHGRCYPENWVPRRHGSDTQRLLPLPLPCVGTRVRSWGADSSPHQSGWSRQRCEFQPLFCWDKRSPWLQQKSRKFTQLEMEVKMRVQKGIPYSPRGASDKEPTCKCRRHKRLGFNPWVKKIPWRRAWQSIKVFLPGKSHRQRSLSGYSP